jgi:tetratricopeptide (TPR) repeat protein
MNEHLTDNEIAAVVQRGLERAERRTVEHLADCGDCNEAFMMASEITHDMAAEENVHHADFGENRGRGWWKVLASASALAAALFIVFGAPLREQWFGSRGTEALADASKMVEKRSTDGRLSGFPFQVRRTLRSGNPEDAELAQYQVDAAAAKILREPDSDPHATGVAYLLRGGGGRPYSGVTAYFEKALAEATPEERPAVVNDYAVALLAQGGDADLAQALSLLEGQWRKEPTPEVAFNRAVALERLGRDKEAVAAWDDYLKLDSNSQWAEEARSRKALMLELNPQLGRP